MTSPIPTAAIDQHIAVLGKTGSGKTYAAKGIVEDLIRSGRQVCVIDPTSAWWGLRSSADGKGQGLSVVLIGGDRADVPLAPKSGSAVARLVTEQGASVVIDTSCLGVGEMTRWFIDFASALHQTVRHPLHLVIDEAHNFMPQARTLDVDGGRMLHAGNKLMAQGRSRGIRGMLITQRPAKLHKDSLTCAETLVAMRVIAPQDRQAIKDWIDGCGNATDGKRVMDSLASLKVGEGWVWYPAGEHLERVRFRPIATFDSSAAPKDGKRPAPRLAEIKLDDVKAALAEAVKEAEANDPKVLRAEVTRLRAELAKPASTPQDDPRLSLRWGVRFKGTLVVACLSESRARGIASLATIDSGATVDVIELARLAKGDMASLPQHTRPAPKPATTAPKSESSERLDLSSAQRRLLDAVAWWRSIGVGEPTRAMVGFVARIKPTGGHFANSIGPLITGGLLVNRAAGSVELSESGAAVAAEVDSQPNLVAYHSAIREVLATGAQRSIFDAIVSFGGEAVDVEAIGARTGISPAGGHFANSIGPLSTLGLITRSRGQVVPTELLFPSALAGGAS